MWPLWVVGWCILPGRWPTWERSQSLFFEHCAGSHRQAARREAAWEWEAVPRGVGAAPSHLEHPSGLEPPPLEAREGRPAKCRKAPRGQKGNLKVLRGGASPSQSQGEGGAGRREFSPGDGGAGRGCGPGRGSARGFQWPPHPGISKAMERFGLGFPRAQ